MLCSPLTAAVQSLVRERMNSANITVLDDEKVVRKGGVYLKCIMQDGRRAAVSGGIGVLMTYWSPIPRLGCGVLAKPGHQIALTGSLALDFLFAQSLASPPMTISSHLRVKTSRSLQPRLEVTRVCR